MRARRFAGRAGDGTMRARSSENVTNRSDRGYIGAGLVVRGKLTGEGNMQIDGRFDGDIACRGALVVGAEGRVDGRVDAVSVTVLGRLRGPVHASDTVAVREGGRIEGDVRAVRIAIDDGGLLDGGIDMEFELPPDLERPEDA